MSPLPRSPPWLSQAGIGALPLTSHRTLELSLMSFVTHYCNSSVCACFSPTSLWASWKKGLPLICLWHFVLCVWACVWVCVYVCLTSGAEGCMCFSASWSFIITGPQRPLSLLFPSPLPLPSSSCVSLHAQSLAKTQSTKDAQEI